MIENSQIAAVAEMVKAQQGQFLGKYRGIVESNEDPSKRGRLLVTVPTVLGKDNPKWAMGAFPIGGNNREAAIAVPSVGSHVLVEFVEGSPKSPVWTATYYPEDAADESAYAPPETFDLDGGTLHMLRTEGGIEFRLEDNRKTDNSAAQRIALHHPKTTDVVIDKNGILTISDAADAEIVMDPKNKVTRVKAQSGAMIEMKETAMTMKHGNSSITFSDSGIVIEAGTVEVKSGDVKLGEGATALIMNAQAFITNVFKNHVHPTTTPSTPTGIPAPITGDPVAASALTKVKGA